MNQNVEEMVVAEHLHMAKVRKMQEKLTIVRNRDKLVIVGHYKARVAAVEVVVVEATTTTSSSSSVMAIHEQYL